jgi:hypothetical protein
LGPQLADIVPEPQALQLFGQFGLYLLVRALNRALHHRADAIPRVPIERSLLLPTTAARA